MEKNYIQSNNQLKQKLPILWLCHWRVVIETNKQCLLVTFMKITLNKQSIFIFIYHIVYTTSVHTHYLILTSCHYDACSAIFCLPSSASPQPSETVIFVVEHKQTSRQTFLQ